MTGASGAASVAGSPLPKWQLALAVGAPVALGLGYMYYKNSTKQSPKSSRDKLKCNSKENGASIEKQISVDESVQPKDATTSQPKIKTPLEEAEKFKQEGNKNFKEGKYNKAIAQYNSAIEICPVDNTEELAIFYQNRAAAYEQLQKYSAVKADCTKALELKPKYAKAFLRRARALEHTNDLEAALEDVTTACILERFSNQSALVMADRVLKQLGRQHATEYIATKKSIMPSIHFIKKYITTFPSDPVFNMLENSNIDSLPQGFLKVLQAVKEQKYDDIIPLCTEELKGSDSEKLPYKMELLLLRGTFLHLLGKHDEAISDFEVIVSSEDAGNAVKVNALIKKAAMFMQLEQPEKCFSDFETAIKLDPTCGDVYHHRGQVHLLLGELEKAKEDFQSAVTMNPNFGVAVAQKCYVDFRYGLMTRNTSMIDQTIKDFESCIEKFPDCAECYTVYAQVLTETQEYEAADNMFAKACERDPNSATVYVHRGLLQLHWKSNVDKAIEYIRKAIELDDKCELGYETLGTIEVQRGNLKEAVELFDKALELGRTTAELAHNFSLRDAAKAQIAIKERLGSDAIWTV